MQALAEIGSLIARHAAYGSVAALPGLRLRKTDRPTEPVTGFYQPAFSLVAQGAKQTMLGGRSLRYRAGQYLVISIDVPIFSCVTQASPQQPYLACSLMLRPAAIATLLLETADHGRDTASTAGLAVSEAPPELLDPMLRLLRLLERPDDLPVLGPLLEREILWRLLRGEQGTLLRQIGLADSRLSQIARAVQWIRRHYAEALRVEQLAAVAGMSPSSFHRHFRAVTAMSPLQYQKQIRLQEARARLLASAHNAADVGYAVGYDSPSQFSREYRRLFGAPPGRDMARLRSQEQPGGEAA